MADIFDELSEDLRAERARAMTMRYGGYGAALLVLVLLAVGGYEAWQWNQRREAQAAAVPFIAAMTAADALPTGGPAPARKQIAGQFAQVAATAPDGYRALARLREAALQADSGDRAAALRLWDQVAADANADPLLRNLADLLWVQHQIDNGDPITLTARLQGLDAIGNSWRPLAQEARAMLALRQNDRPASVRILRGLSSDPGASEAVRERAAGLLSVLGETPGEPG